MVEVREEDRIYPMPQTHWSQKELPEEAREFDIARKLGALRAPGAGYLVIPEDLSARAKAILRDRFGGAPAKRRRESAMEELRADTAERAKDREAVLAAGGTASETILFASGDATFSRDALFAAAKDESVKVRFDRAGQFYLLRGSVPEALKPWAGEEARSAWVQWREGEREKSERRASESVAALMGQMEGRIRTDWAFRLPAPERPEFAEGVRILGDLRRKDLVGRIAEMADGIVGGERGEDVMRGFRAALLVEGGGEKVNPELLKEVPHLREALAYVGKASSDEKLVVREALAGDDDYVPAADKVREARKLGAEVLRAMEMSERQGMGVSEFVGAEGFQIKQSRSR